MKDQAIATFGLLLHVMFMLPRPAFGFQRLPLNITAVTGITVELKCKVKLHECGNFNGIEWYREPISPQTGETPSEIIETRERVYVYRHHSGISKPEGLWAGRARHVYDTKKHLMRVKLSPLRLHDEAAYSCEITYEEPGRWFKDSCQDPQMTMLNVLGKPEEVVVAMENGTELEDGAILGPYTEGTHLVLRCKASGGRPIPEVVWNDGAREIPNSWHWRVEHDNGTGSVQSEINVELSRVNLGLPLICKVNSTALDAPVERRIHVNMEVAPNELIMDRPHDKETNQADVPEGGRLSVTCIAKGAKPQAYIYWNSEPELSKDDIHEEVTREANGLTFQTLNRLTFSAQKELTSLSCFASNKALDERKGVHLKQTTTINVKFKPEVLQQQNSSSSAVKIINAVDGEPLKIECNFKANPTVGANIKWYRNGHLIDHPSQQVGSILKIEANKDTSGLYGCEVENEVGRSPRVDIAHIYVEEKPRVTLYFEPRQPVSEVSDANVTLMCSSNFGSAGGNFISVKWYLDGDLLKQVDRAPECIQVPNPNKTNCNVDPSKVMLLNVKRSFRGNYSCQAQNRAGWGPISEGKEMMVLYPPEGTTIYATPELVLKNKPFQILCAVKDGGFPRSQMVRWLHNGQEIKDKTGYTLANNHADAHSAGNYSCVPFNQVGMAQPVTTSIRIQTPPNFIRSLPPVSGIPFQHKSVELKCIVECFPLCDIVWQRNNTPIPIATKRSLAQGVVEGSGSMDKFTKFTVKTASKEPNVSDNILEHVESSLILDFNDWPDDQLTHSDMKSYSCISSANALGPSVQSSTQVRVHYPPQNIEVNPRIQNVLEKGHVADFSCEVEAFPKAKYFWNFEDGNYTTLGPILTFRHGARRYQTGTYTCTAYNELGSLKQSVSLNVHYKPSCRIRNKETSDGGLNLRCDVDAFPSNVTFVWTHNEDPIPASNGPTLHYRHANSLLKKAKEGDADAVSAIFGTFACLAANEAGLGDKCSISIDGPPSALVAETDTTYLIFGGASVVLLLIIIVVSIILCRRHYAVVTKYDADNATGVNRIPEPEKDDPVPVAAGANPVFIRKTTNNEAMLNDIAPIEPLNHHSYNNTFDVYEMRHSPNMAPPPPMYRRAVVPPPNGNGPAHMMTLDRRIPHHVQQVQHRLIPNGCDVTLNRRHFNHQGGGIMRGMTRRLPEDLWLV